MTRVYGLLDLALLKTMAESGYLVIEYVVATNDPKRHLVQWEHTEKGVALFGRV